MISQPSPSAIFWKNIEDVRHALLMDEAEFSAFLDLGQDEYLKHRERQQFLPVSRIFELAQRFNFDEARLFEANFDISQITDIVTADNTVDERYKVATYSRTTPVLNLINYVRETRGPRAYADLLRRFKLSPRFFTPEQRTNVLLISDVAMYLEGAYGFSDAEFMAMGRRTPQNPNVKHFNLKEKLCWQKDIQTTLEYFVNECAGLFDTNFDYKIHSLNEGHALIDATLRPSVSEELGVAPSEIGNEKVCYSRMGVFSSVSWYKYARFASITKVSSIHRGDRTNRYLMDLSPFRVMDNYAAEFFLSL